MRLRTFYSTIVLSDIHLGTSHSKTVEVSNFLKSVNCRRLILNGDIIDGWALSKGSTRKWQAKHTDFFKVIMKMMENFLSQFDEIDMFKTSIYGYNDGSIEVTFKKDAEHTGFPLFLKNTVISQAINYGGATW